MSLHRRNPKRDGNEKPIIDALTAVGAFVAPLSADGVPDLAVLFRGETYWLEVKATKGKLTKSQVEWHGQAINCSVKVHVVTSANEALKAIGAID